MGHVPRVVLLPTFHFQVMVPDPPAFFGPRPFAMALPDAYSTSIKHEAPSVVLIVTEAVALRRTDFVRFVTFTPSGFVVGVADGSGSSGVTGPDEALNSSGVTTGTS